MGFLRNLRDLLGFGAESSASQPADPDDLFGLSTAYITMETELGYEPIPVASLCFAEIDSTDFAETVTAVKEIVIVGEQRTLATVSEDSRGYNWVVIEDDDFEDLIVGIHAAADEFIANGYGSRILAAVFCFERNSQRAYWIYSFRRGSYYPFVPTGDHERDHGIEFKLESVLDGELSLESDKSYWYPLWPDSPDLYP
jgi:hypothetical protein